MTGVKSRSTAYGSFAQRLGAIEWGDVMDISSVQPSGAGLATRSDPIAPPAPGRLSTTIDVPSASPSRCASVRATMSVAPLGGNGATSLIGFAGYDCANAGPAPPRPGRGMPRAGEAYASRFLREDVRAPAPDVGDDDEQQQRRRHQQHHERQRPGDEHR